MLAILSEPTSRPWYTGAFKKQALRVVPPNTEFIAYGKMNGVPVTRWLFWNHRQDIQETSWLQGL